MSSRTILCLILLGSVVTALIAVVQLYVNRDYYVLANIACDPTKASCFVGDGIDAPDFYSTIEKKAHDIPACDGWNDACPQLSCGPGDADCSEIFCEGEECYSEHTADK